MLIYQYNNCHFDLDIEANVIFLLVLLEIICVFLAVMYM
jgi:hypothetical protein